MTSLDRIQLLCGDNSVPLDMIELMSDIVTARVKAYCRRDDIPEGLQMVIDQITAHAIMDSVGGGTAGTVKMGDTSIELKSSAATTWMDNYSRDLKCWRRL